MTEYDLLIDKIVAIFNENHSKEFCEDILEQVLKRLHKRMYIKQY